MLRRRHYGESPADIGRACKSEENDVIRKTAEEGRRKSYIITDTGRQMLKDEYERLKTMVRDGDTVWNAGFSDIHF